MVAAKITHINSASKNIEIEGDHLIATLRQELIIYINNGGKLINLETKCGGYPKVTTISRILHGTTKEPRFLTVLILLKALGYKIYAVKKKK